MAGCLGSGLSHLALLCGAPLPVGGGGHLGRPKHSEPLTQVIQSVCFYLQLNGETPWPKWQTGLGSLPGRSPYLSYTPINCSEG